MATVSQKSQKAKTKPPKSRPLGTSSLNQPVTADTASLAALSSFSPDGKWFALLSLAVDKHRLRIFNTTTSLTVAETIVQGAHVTCLRWAKIGSSVDFSQSKKRKRKSVEEPGSQALQVVVLGLSTGGISFFSPTTAEFVLSLSHPLSIAPVLDAVVDVDEQRLWTTSKDSAIRLWSIQTNTVIHTWKSESRIPYSSLSLIDDQVLAAHHSIHLLELEPDSEEDISKPTIIANFSGHTTSITSILLPPSSRHFLTSAERDRFVHGWVIPKKGKEGKLHYSASVDADIRKISLRGEDFLITSASGSISLFRVPTDSNPESPEILQPQSVIGITISKGKGSSEPAEVLDAAFLEDRNSIQVARLVAGARPVFETILFTDDQDNVLPEIKIKHKETPLISSQAADLPSSSNRYKEGKGLTISSGVENPQEDTIIQEIEGELDVGLAELSLGQRLKSTTGRDAILTDSDSSGGEEPLTKKSEKKSKKLEVPTESLSRTLIQALHSSDTRLLESCLTHSDPTLIRNTVRKIPPQLALALLQACVDRLGRGRGGNTGKMRGGGASAQRGTTLVLWVKTVLIIHSGHLMTVPNLVAKLAALHATLTSRMALQDRLLQLSGRLDLALSQIELRSSQAPASHLDLKKGKKAKPATKYVEGESSDEEMEDVEVEKGSDDGTVEDIGLDAREGDDDSEEEIDGDEDDSEEEEDDEDDEGDEDDDDEDDDDEDDDSDAPKLNGLIDDEAEESWGSDDDEELSDE